MGRASRFFKKVGSGIKKLGGKLKTEALGESPRTEERPFPYTPEQIESLNQSLQAGGPALFNLLQQLQQPVEQQLQQPQFGPIREQAERGFYTEELPGLMERLGSPLGSDYQGRLGAAGAGLRSDLAAQESGFQERAFGRDVQQQDIGLRRQNLGAQLGQYLQSIGLTPQKELLTHPGKEGFIQRLLPMAAQAATTYFGAPNLLGGVTSPQTQPGPQVQQTPQPGGGVAPITDVARQQPLGVAAQQPIFGTQQQQTPFSQYAQPGQARFPGPEEYAAQQYRRMPGAEQQSNRIMNAISAILAQQRPNQSLSQRMGGLS